MTQEDIIRMAREVGFDPDYFDNIECPCDECNFLKKPLERFAALVAAHEREQCAKVCEPFIGTDKIAQAERIQSAIRARSQS